MTPKDLPTNPELVTSRFCGMQRARIWTRKHMKVKERRRTFWVLLLGLITTNAWVASNSKVAASLPLQAPPDSPDAAAQRALVDKYCVTCHNSRAKTAGLVLEDSDFGRVAESAETWEKVARKLRGGMMPPQGMPRPEQTSIDRFVSSLEMSIDRGAKTNPGRSPLHRLNRSEYANAIRDLIELDIDATSLLPADDESNGFDNIADVLKVSPSLLEQYLAASRKISALAVGNPATAPVSQVYRVPPDRSQEDHIEGLPLGTRGGILIRHDFPLDAQYDFSVGLLQNIVGYLPGLEWPHQLEIGLDGRRVVMHRV